MADFAFLDYCGHLLLTEKVLLVLEWLELISCIHKVLAIQLTISKVHQVF